MERISRALRSVLHHLRDTRGVSLYEITAAVAMTGILAAVAVPVILDKVSEAKSARAVQEVDSIYKAVTAFANDTLRMPGEREGAALLLSDVTFKLPNNTGKLSASGITIDGTSNKCTSTGLPGDPVVAGAGKCHSLNDYLVGKNGVGPTGYENWRGPYMDAVRADPFDRTYIMNIRALYAGEGVGCNVKGYGWVLSGGSDRKLETALTDTKLFDTSDDIGKNNGKKISANATPCP